LRDSDDKSLALYSDCYLVYAGTMSALGEYKKEIGAGAVVAAFGILILATISSYYFPSGAAQTNAGCSQADINQPPPSDLFRDAPVQGYTYLVVYNTTNGAIVSGQTELSCELGGKLPLGPFEPCTTQCQLASPIPAHDEAWLNVTADQNLRPMEANGYVNAFYVNLNTKSLTLIPGVTFSGSYTQAFYNGQPITNGTKLQIPPQ
jgi:hypothetical protein